MGNWSNAPAVCGETMAGSCTSPVHDVGTGSGSLSFISVQSELASLSSLVSVPSGGGGAISSVGRDLGRSSPASMTGPKLSVARNTTS